MIQFETIILRFGEAGHKTGWTYIDIPMDIAQELFPGNRKSFRVKGQLDQMLFSGVALLPIGDGSFCLPINQQMRKALRKSEGAMLNIQIAHDTDFEIKIPDDLLACLEDEPEALRNFRKLTKSHRDYFINWIESAKTEPTKVARISRTLEALSLGYNYSQMMRLLKDDF